MKKKYWEYTIVGLSAFVLSILNQLQVITQWFANPPDRLFAGISHYYADFFLYISHMRQGTNMTLLYDHAFTNELIRPTWIYWFNMLLGFIGSKFGLHAFTTYNVSLFIMAVFLVCMWYVFVSILYPKNTVKRLMSFFFILTASSFLNFTSLINHQTLEFSKQFWFSPGLSFIRMGGVPHQMFQTIVFLIFVLLYGNILEKEKTTLKNYILLALVSFLTTSANPQQMMLASMAVALMSGYYLVMKKKTLSSLFVPAMTTALVTLPTALLTLREFTIPVFEYARTWEMQQSLTVPLISFYIILGPIGLFLPFGVKRYLKKTTPVSLLLFLYGLMSFLVFFSPLPKLLNGPAPRFLHPAPYAILAVLATEGIISIATWTSKRINSLNITSITVLLIGVYSLITFPSLYVQIRDRIDTNIQDHVLLLTTDYNHIPQTTVDAFKWLESQPHDKTREVVLMDATFRYEVLVPALSHMKSFSAHPLHTMFFRNKENMRDDFFNGVYTVEQIRKFLNDHRIGYIFSSHDTVPGFLDYMPFLRREYENEVVLIYSVVE